MLEQFHKSVFHIQPHSELFAMGVCKKNLQYFYPILFLCITTCLAYEEHYKDCAKKQNVCFGSDDNCISSHNCRFFVIIRPEYNNDDDYHIANVTLIGSKRGYVATGFSKKPKMEEMNALECLDGRIEASFSRTAGRPQRIPNSDRTVTNRLSKWDENKQKLYCTMDLDLRAEPGTNGSDHPYKTEKYFVYLAQGNVNDDGSLIVHNHDDRRISPEPVLLVRNGAVGLAMTFVLVPVLLGKICYSIL